MNFLKINKIFFLLVVSILLLLLFIPFEPDNPPARNSLKANSQIKEILKRACNDCHSNETKWPFYARFYPIGLYFNMHVRNGREELNFSEWGKYSQKEKVKKSFAIVDSIEAGDMPPKLYILFHKNAKINEEDLAVLKTWADNLESNGIGEELEEEE